MRRVILTDAQLGRVVGVLDATRQHWLAEARKQEIGSDGYALAQSRAASVHELQVALNAAEVF